MHATTILGRSDSSLAIARFNVDGTPDTDFSGDGFQTYWPNANTVQGFTVNLQTDGKIVVGGLIGYDAAVWRYDHTGELDTSFDTDGIRHTTLGIGNSGDRWLAVAHTGSHLFIGGFNDYNTNDGQDFAVMKLNAGVALNQTLYFQQDANFNVTSVTDANGNVLERYRYTPYGERTVLNTNFTVKTNATASDYGNTYGHQGGKQDLFTMLILFRHREYHTALGTWAQRDPAGYIDGQSLYEYIRSRPVSLTDPQGLQATTTQPATGPTTQPTTGPTTQPSTQPSKIEADAAGISCCPSDMKSITLKILKPKESPVKIGLENKRQGRPVEAGIDPGHTFLDLGNGNTYGFWPRGGWPNADGEIRTPDPDAGLETHSVTFRLCPESLKKLQDAIDQDMQNIANLDYRLVDILEGDNNYQCTTWAIERLRAIGIQIPRASDPHAAAENIPGVNPVAP